MGQERKVEVEEVYTRLREVDWAHIPFGIRREADLLHTVQSIQYFLHMDWVRTQLFQLKKEIGSSNMRLIHKRIIWSIVHVLYIE